MTLTFQNWLFQQEQREDQIGKLARAMSAINYNYNPPRRKSDEHKKWADIVTRHGQPEHILAFNEAWREYLEARQANIA